MKLSNKTYNAIKWIITIFLPALGAFYFALAQTWGFENSQGVNATINAVITFLGLLIGYSSRQYRKNVEERTDGDLIITEVDGEQYTMLGVNKSLETMAGKDTVKLNVVKDPPQ